MAKRYWNMGIVRLFNDVLYEEALSQTPNGLRYHLIDICVEELAKVNKDATVPLTEATFLDCLEPFFAMAQRVDDKNVQKRVMNSVLLKFLNEYSFVSEVAIRNESEQDDAKLLIFRHVHVGTVANFIFEIASDSDTDERYRKGLYEMHKTFVRQIRVAGRDVDTEDDKEEDETGLGVANDDATMENDQEDVEPPKPSDEPVSASSKKAKKKKKKKKQKEHKTEDESTSSDVVTPSDVTTAGDEPSTESSKKKKRTHKEINAQESEPTTSALKKSSQGNNEDQTSKDGDSVPSAKVTKKKKRKQHEMKESKTEDEASSKLNGPDPSEATPAPKRKKKKKKQQESTPAGDSHSTTDSNRAGEVRPQTNQTNISPASLDREEQSSLSASKRVSFGAMNQSKSHNASMKALKTLTPKVWSTANRTPDKGILIKRPESEGKEKKASSRKQKAKKNS